jgi:hypothetical protein
MSFLCCSRYFCSESTAMPLPDRLPKSIEAAYFCAGIVKHVYQLHLIAIVQKLRLLPIYQNVFLRNSDAGTAFGSVFRAYWDMISWGLLIFTAAMAPAWFPGPLAALSRVCRVQSGGRAGAQAPPSIPAPKRSPDGRPSLDPNRRQRVGRD